MPKSIFDWPLWVWGSPDLCCLICDEVLITGSESSNGLGFTIQELQKATHHHMKEGCLK